MCIVYYLCIHRATCVHVTKFSTSLHPTNNLHNKKTVKNDLLAELEGEERTRLTQKSCEDQMTGRHQEITNKLTSLEQLVEDKLRGLEMKMDRLTSMEQRLDKLTSL